MELIYKSENRIRNWTKKYICFLIFNVLFGIIIYFMIMSENLFNDMDGIWHTSNFVAGNWEISLGRGLLRYFDKLRFGVVSVPFNTILTLLVVGIANTLLIDLFSVTNRFIAFLMAGLIIANPVICFTLSYSYTSINYGLSYLFAIGAVYAFSKIKKWISIVLAGAFIMISMGCYQAYIGVVGIIFLMILMRMFIRNDNKKNIADYMIRGVCSILLGGFLYILMTNLLLKKAGVDLASYRGASSVSLSSITSNFLISVMQCYRNFITFFTNYQMYNTMSLTWIILGGLSLISIFCMGYQFVVIYKTNKWYAAGYLISILLVPVFCNCMLIVAVGNNVSLLMAMGMMLYPVLSVIFLPETGKVSFWTKRMWCLIMLLLLWTNVLTVTNDQVALKEGKTATVELADQIISTLNEEGYLENDYVIALVGRPSENNLFSRNAAYQNANEYAKFGNFWSTEAGNNRRSWQGVLSEYCGINLNLCSEDQYNAIIQNEKIANMPEFPLEGSLLEIDGVIVVKVSQLY